MKNTIKLILRACIILLVALCLMVKVSADQQFDITLTPSSDGYGQMYIEWKSQGYDYQDKYFKVFRQPDGQNFQQTQIDYTQIKSVKCLQVYPKDEVNGRLKEWIQDSGYGNGNNQTQIISVDSISIQEFNNNPQAYLQDSQGNWKYDVIFFGTWDQNNGNDLQAQAQNWVEQFINCGKGAIFGHDTIVNNWFNHVNFRRLANYVGIRIVDNAIQLVQTKTVIIVKQGLFTTYPNYIGDIGTRLTVPETHQIGQVVSTGTSWLQFDSEGQIMENGEIAPQYLTTYNNCAMIQTGHSDGQATPDEQKILANLVFYCYQMLFGSYYVTDMAAMDYAAPNAPSLTRTQDNIKITQIDNGQTYYYYVQSFDKNNTQLSGKLAQQPTKSHTVTTGVKKYLYVADNQEQTVVTSSNGQVLMGQTQELQAQQISKFKYLHVAAVDGANNLSETTTITLPVVVKYDKNNQNAVGYMPDDTLGVQGQLIAKESGYTLQEHRFKGWNTKANGSGKWFNPGDTIQYDDYIETNKDILTLYAQWEQNKNLIINPSGGTWTLNNIQYTSPTQIQLFKGDSLMIPDAIKIGYNFYGWGIESENNSAATMLPNNTWYKSDISRSTIKEIHVVKSLPSDITIQQQWNAAEEQTGTILCAIDTDNKLWISQEGQNRIMLNADQTNLFQLNTGQFFYNVTLIDGLELFDASNVKTFYRAFAYFGQKQKSIKIDGINNWNVQNVTNMQYMFMCFGDANITGLDLSYWDVQSVKDFSYMFQITGDAFYIGDLGNWDVQNAEDMQHMFDCFASSARQLYLGDLGRWDTKNVKDMSQMFYMAGNQANTWDIGDISTWNTGNVTDMSGMFSCQFGNATSVDIGDIGKWNTQSVTDMSNMFYTAGQKLTDFYFGELGNWDVQKVENMDYMFYQAGIQAKQFNLGDLGRWDTQSLKSLGQTFQYSGSSAENWYCGELKNWDTSKVENMKRMFYLCRKANTSIVVMNPNTKFDYSTRYTATAAGQRLDVYYAAGCYDAAYEMCKNTGQGNVNIIGEI